MSRLITSMMTLAGVAALVFAMSLAKKKPKALLPPLLVLLAWLTIVLGLLLLFVPNFFA